MLSFHLIAASLGVATAMWAESSVGGRRWKPPGWSNPLRQALATSCMAFVLWLAVFEPLATFGSTPNLDFDSIPVWSLFIVQFMLLGAVATWWALGWVGQDASTPQPGVQGSEQDGELSAPPPSNLWTRLRPQLASLGLWSERPVRELALGLGAGFLAWGAVLLAIIVLAVLALVLGGESWVSQPPSELIVWMVELGIGTRLLISLSAGVVEEIFFRGYLQPRIGIIATTVLFVAAHAGYGRPFLLIAVALLSLLYGALSRWRGSVWAAISAHFLFDAVQLLVVIPAALRTVQQAS